jgi:hypothetical protein
MDGDFFQVGAACGDNFNDWTAQSIARAQMNLL